MDSTPTAGLVKSTRSGDLDPGLFAYFARSEGMTPRRSSTNGNTNRVCWGSRETSSDIRDLQAREQREGGRGSTGSRSATRRRNLSERSVRHWAAWTPWCSRSALVKTPLRCARAFAMVRICRDRLDPGRNAANGPVISVPGAELRCASFALMNELHMARSVPHAAREREKFEFKSQKEKIHMNKSRINLHRGARAALRLSRAGLASHPPDDGHGSAAASVQNPGRGDGTRVSRSTWSCLRKMDAYWRAANYLSVGKFISTTIRS